MKRTLVICVLLAFLSWGIPFFLTLFLDFGSHDINMQEDHGQHTKNQVVDDIMTAYSTGDRMTAFRLIFLNNLKVTIINVIGGIFLGIGTIINLLQNGFYTASVFSSIHQNGMSWKDIFAHTAPHSIEMLGIWLSGGLGFFIAKSIFGIMINNSYPSIKFYKTVGIGVIVSGLFILIAAYIEAFISVS